MGLWSLLFLMFAGIAAIFGFTSFSVSGSGIAKILCIFFSMLFLIFLYFTKKKKPSKA